MRRDLKSISWYRVQGGGGRQLHAASPGRTVLHLLRDLTEVVLAAAAILAPHLLLRPPEPPPPIVQRVESPVDLSGLEGRLAALESEIDKALEPYRWEVLKNPGERRPQIRRVETP